MMDYLFLLPVCFLVLSVVLATRAVKRGTKTKKAVAVQLVSFLVVTLFCFGVPMVAQAADASTAAAAASSANGMGLIAAALSTGIAGIGGGIDEADLSAAGGGVAVASAASAALGAISENDKAFGKALIFVALGEGIALYALLVSILILAKI